MKLRFYMRGLGIGILVTALVLGVSLRNHNGKMTDEEVIKRAEELGMEQKYDTGTLADMNAGQKSGKEDTAEDAVSAETAKEEQKQTADSDQAATGEKEAVKENASDANAKADDGSNAKTTEAKAEETKVDQSEEKKEDAATENADQQKDETESGTEVTDDKQDQTEDKAEEKAENQSELKAEETAVTADNTTETQTDAKVEETKEPEQKAEEKPEEKAEETTPATDITKTESVFVIKSGEGSDTVAKHLAEAGYVQDGAAYDAFLCSKGYDTKLRAGEHKIPAGANAQQIAEALMTSPEE